MRQAAAALKTYLSGFGIPAYTTESVPDNVALPYITYPATIPEWTQAGTFYIQIWDRTTSNTSLLTKADEILHDIWGGKRIQTEDGVLVLWPESPACQILVDGDIRSAYINLSINAYHTPGT